MSQEIRNLKKKFWGYLHDPVHKALTLARRIGHEQEARDLSGELHVSLEEEPRADHIASALDRLLIPRASQEKYTQVSVNFEEAPQVRHPLMAGRCASLDLPEASMEGVRDALRKALAKVADVPHHGEGTDELFLALWEGYQPLAEMAAPHLAEVIAKFPADTRIPDHTIWDHLSAVSAMAGALPAPAFLVFSISPVQEFIRTARKTRDFWLGSYILSYLCWNAMEAVVECCGPDSIVFPDLHHQPLFHAYLKRKLGQSSTPIESVLKDSQKKLHIPSLPNRFLAVIPGSQAENLVAATVERAERALASLETHGTAWLKAHVDSSDWDEAIGEIIARQCRHYFRFSSSIVPWSLDLASRDSLDADLVISRLVPPLGQADDPRVKFLKEVRNLTEYGLNIGSLYQVLYEVAERLAASRKSLRLPLAGEQEPGYKCTLCGEREALHASSQVGWDEVSGWWRRLAGKSRGLVGPVDRLCGLCSMKRLSGGFFESELGMKPVSFDSTADIAAQPAWEAALAKHPERAREFRRSIEALGVPWSGQWLFRDELTRAKLAGADGQPPMERVVRDLRNQLEGVVEGHPPARYYGIIRFDGDSLGEILKGNRLPDLGEVYHPEALQRIRQDYPAIAGKLAAAGISRPVSQAIHRTISRALRFFSLDLAPHAVEKVGMGQLVYAGGDDVLALLPLERFFEVLNLLRAFYSGEVAGEDGGWRPDYGNEKSGGWLEFEKRHGITMGSTSTASVGAAIVSWQEPLAAAIALAGQAEREAKAGGRNSCCLLFKRRSGEIRRASFQWYYQEGTDRIDFIQQFVHPLANWFGKGKSRKGLSPGFLQTLKQEFYPLASPGIPGTDAGDLRKLMIHELERTMKRACPKDWRPRIQDWCQALGRLGTQDHGSWRQTNPADSPMNVIALMEIVHFVTRGGE